MATWLIHHWVAGAVFLAIAMTLMVPLLDPTWSMPLLLIFAMLPIYMFHQVEEHVGDRFRCFVNDRLFNGKEVLTPIAVLWINIPGVWGIGFVSVYAATFAGVGWGLSIVYLVLVNAVLHVIAAARWREYNPGLWTALLLFLPFGVLTLLKVNQQAQIQWFHHALGLMVAVAIHVMIVLYTGLPTATSAERRS